jgi:hypothetical protein
MDAMKVTAVLTVAIPLMAVAGMPAVAAQPVSPVAQGSPLQGSPLRIAASDDFSARKDDYVRRAGDEMNEWRSKLHATGEQAEDKAHEASAETKAHLDRAWAATERNWRRLKGVSAEGWEKSKNAYERSVAELRAQWHKIHPENND